MSYGDTAIGVDIKITDNDIGTTASGDLDVIGVYDSANNVWQAVWLRLFTALDTYYFANDYGTYAKQLIDESITDQMLKNLKTQISTTVAQDPRVLSIYNLRISDAGNGHVEIAFGIITTSGASAYNSGTI